MQLKGNDGFIEITSDFVDIDHIDKVISISQIKDINIENLNKQQINDLSIKLCCLLESAVIDNGRIWGVFGDAASQKIDEVDNFYGGVVKNPDLYLKLAQFQASSGNFEKAIQYCDKMGKDESVVWKIKTDSLFHLERYDEALHNYAKYFVGSSFADYKLLNEIKHIIFISSVVFGSNNVHQNTDDNKSSIDNEYGIVENGNTIDGKFADEWIVLGYIKANFYRDFKYAIECFSKALIINPADQTALNDRQEAINDRKRQICREIQFFEILENDSFEKLEWNDGCDKNTFAAEIEQLIDDGENKAYDFTIFEKDIENMGLINIMNGKSISELTIESIDDELCILEQKLQLPDIKKISMDLDKVEEQLMSLFKKGLDATKSERMAIAKEMHVPNLQKNRLQEQKKELLDNYRGESFYHLIELHQDLKALILLKGIPIWDNLILRLDKLPPEKLIWWLIKFPVSELKNESDKCNHWCY